MLSCAFSSVTDGAPELAMAKKKIDESFRVLSDAHKRFYGDGGRAKVVASQKETGPPMPGADADGSTLFTHSDQIPHQNIDALIMAHGNS